MSTNASRTIKLFLLFVASIVVLLMVAARPAYASDDVVTVHADRFVYCGGTMDLEVEAQGFTPVSYHWKIKYISGIGTVYMDCNEKPAWYHGTETNHLTIDTRDLVDGSSEMGWDPLRIYCVVTDTKGKKHYSEDFKLNVASVDEFKARAQHDGALSLNDIYPARSQNLYTNVYMNTGYRTDFGFNAVPASWMADCDPYVEYTFGILYTDPDTKKCSFDIKEGKELRFVPQKRGEYIICPVTALFMGYGYDTKIASDHFYRVTVEDPPDPVTPDPPTPDPQADVVGSLGGLEIFLDGFYTATPYAGDSIPPVSMYAPTELFPQVSFDIGWYKRTSSGWQSVEKLGESTFEGGADYRCQVMATAMDGWKLQPSNRFPKYTFLYKPQIYDNDQLVDTQRLIDARMQESTSVYCVYVIRSLTAIEVADEGANSSEALEDMHTEKGWKHDGYGWQFYKSNGELAKSEWCGIGGKWYYFGSDSYMATGWTKVSGKWYYLDQVNGDMKTGWQKVASKWYYLDSKGVMQVGWLTLGEKKYHLASSGAMDTGWTKIDGKWYFFDSKGVMVTKWLKKGGVYYYLGTDGVMVTGWQKISGSWYFFNTSGAMQVGWVKDSGKWYYFFSSGKMATGTQVINGKTYKFSSSGAWLG